MLEFAGSGVEVEEEWRVCPKGFWGEMEGDGHPGFALSPETAGPWSSQSL